MSLDSLTHSGRGREILGDRAELTTRVFRTRPGKDRGKDGMYVILRMAKPGAIVYHRASMERYFPCDPLSVLSGIYGPDRRSFALKLALELPRRMRGVRALAIAAILFSIASPLKAGFTAGLYFIVSQAFTGFCIDLPSNLVSKTEGPIQVFNPTGGFTQKWDFIADSAHPGSFLIKWHDGDKYLQPVGKSQDNVPIEFNKRDESVFQDWVLVDAGNGQYYIQNDGSGKVITVMFPGVIILPSVVQNDKNPRANPEQIWTLQGTSP
jgi:hypothetical protein